MQKGVVSVCATCRYAEWETTAAGRRHPNGIGRCAYDFPESPLPKWIGEWRYSRRNERVTTWRELVAQKWPVRQISWRDTWNTVPYPCDTWAAK
jgi:hypothetical protein